jgi:hypothetical protein
VTVVVFDEQERERIHRAAERAYAPYTDHVAGPGEYQDSLRVHYVGAAGEYATLRALHEHGFTVWAPESGWDVRTRTTGVEVKTRLGNHYDTYGLGVAERTVLQFPTRERVRAAVVVYAQAHGVATDTVLHVHSVTLHGFEHVSVVAAAERVLTRSSIGDNYVYRIERPRPFPELVDGIRMLEPEEVTV